VNPAWIGAIGSLIAVIAAVKPLRWAFRLIIGTHEFIAEWPKIRGAIAELRQEVSVIKAETQPNGGSSLRDVLHRTAADVTDIKTEQARLRAQMQDCTPERKKPDAG